MAHHRGPFRRGTTIKAMELKVSKPIVYVCSQIRDRYDRVVYEYRSPHTEDSIVLEEIPPSRTSSFPVGTLFYDVKVTFQDGTTDVLLHGSTIEIEAEVSRCS